MRTHLRMLPVFLVAVVALVVGAAVPVDSAEEFDEVEVFIEVNDTDGDAGIQIFLDGEGWKEVTLIGPEGKELMVKAKGGVKEQGLTEMFFESTEPSFEEQPLEDFLALFPEGEYKFRGKSVEGEKLEGTAILTHNLPDAPEIVSPEEEEEVDADDPLTIEWNTVADPDPPASEIVAYQIVVEKDVEDERLRVLSVDMLPADTEVTVPEGFLEAGKDYKVEVLAIETSGNKTITEVEFATEE